VPSMGVETNDNDQPEVPPGSCDPELLIAQRDSAACVAWTEVDQRTSNASATSGAGATGPCTVSLWRDVIGGPDEEEEAAAPEATPPVWSNVRRASISISAAGEQLVTLARSSMSSSN
jgi:hypothetical protein